MIDYDSFLHCHLADIFFAFRAGAKELRYTKGEKVNESFTGFVKMSSVSGESISAAILAHLSRIGVDLRKLVGQAYDGASTVTGHVLEWSSKTHSQKVSPPSNICALCCTMFERGH